MISLAGGLRRRQRGSFKAAAAAAGGPAFRSSSTAASVTGSITVSAPAGTTTGDQLIIVHRSFYDAKSGTPGFFGSAGWTLITAPTNYLGRGFAIYRKTAGASETSYTWSGGTNWLTGNLSVIAISGASAFDVAGTISTTLVASSVTTTTATDVLVFVGSESVSAVSLPGGMTSRVTYANPAAVQIATQTLSASGSTGTRTATSTGSDSAYSILLAVK